MTDNENSCHPSSAIRHPINGWIILDKPSGITSAHAVAKVKRLLRPDKIGHAGTLDPLASGILPLALGEATKTVAYMMDTAKSYSFTVSWGEGRDTDDCEGKTTETSEKRPTEAEIQAILPQFNGLIQQMPPSYSAIKVDGKRAYDLARSGETVELKAREVRVDSLIISPSPLAGECRDGGASDRLQAHGESPHPNLPPQGGKEYSTFLCHCGKGTYIRSLARDMGRLLGCYGHITMLRRLSVGRFNETCAISLEMLEKMVHKGDLNFVQPVESALDDIPACELDSSQAMLLTRGQTIFLPNISEESANPIRLARHDGRLIAICSVAGRAMKPMRVFNL